MKVLRRIHMTHIAYAVRDAKIPDDQKRKIAREIADVLEDITPLFDRKAFMCNACDLNFRDPKVAALIEKDRTLRLG